MEQIICHIKDQLQGTGFFKVIYPFTKIKVRKEGTHQAMYYNGGGWKSVNNWDVNGMAYLRKRFDVRLGKYTGGVKVTSCSDTNRLITAVVPFRLVIAVPRANLPESLVMDDLLIFDLLSVLQGSLGTVAEEMGAIDVVLNGTSYSTNEMEVFSQENNGIDFNEATVYKFVYASIDLDVTISGDINCLRNCLTDPYTYTQ